MYNTGAEITPSCGGEGVRLAASVCLFPFAIIQAQAESIQTDSGFVQHTRRGVCYEHSLPYNSKSVMGERTAPHFTGDSSPLTSRLVT